MDYLNRYRSIIRDLILEYSQHRPARGDIQVEVVFEEAQDHYELIYAGWNGPYRIHGSVLHLDIRDGKVWIQYDGTAEGIAERLERAGIPREHIVLAFKAPEMRPYTGYAAG
jgi:hypothetical protein